MLMQALFGSCEHRIAGQAHRGFDKKRQSSGEDCRFYQKQMKSKNRQAADGACRFFGNS